jgi:hypothetical protein
VITPVPHPKIEHDRPEGIVYGDHSFFVRRSRGLPGLVAIDWSRQESANRLVPTGRRSLSFAQAITASG